jgi:hypothetical protein
LAIPTARRPHALDGSTEKSIRPTKARRRRRSTMVIENASISIDQALRARAKLENEIELLLYRFQEQTGLTVDGVHARPLSFQQVKMIKPNVMWKVRVDVKL